MSLLRSLNLTPNRRYKKLTSPGPDLGYRIFKNAPRFGSVVEAAAFNGAKYAAPLELVNFFDVAGYKDSGPPGLISTSLEPAHMY